MERIKIRADYLLREVVGDFVVVPIGEASKSFRGMIQLNAVGAFLWEQCCEETTVEQVVSAVMDKYEVSRQEAEQDVKDFIGKLEQGGLLEKFVD